MLEDTTPWPVFDESTGRLYLSDGIGRQVVARFGKDGNIYLWWKWGSVEVPLGLDLILDCHKKATEN